MRATMDMPAGRSAAADNMPGRRTWLRGIGGAQRLRQDGQAAA